MKRTITITAYDGDGISIKIVAAVTFKNGGGLVSDERQRLLNNLADNLMRQVPETRHFACSLPYVKVKI